MDPPTAAPAPPARVGLLGGTFDPPHVGHLVVAEEARVALGLDHVRFVVAGAPWMKTVTTSPEHRVAMTGLAVAGTGFRVDRREVDRGGPTYTIDTLRDLVREEPGVRWTLLLGADAAADLPRWHGGAAVDEYADLVVLSRPGFAGELPRDVRARVQRLEVTGVDISSTELRRRFSSGGAVRFLVRDTVASYVERHHLYGAI